MPTKWEMVTTIYDTNRLMGGNRIQAFGCAVQAFFDKEYREDWYWFIFDCERDWII